MINIDSRIPKELKGDEIKLLLILCNYSNKNRTCWPSVKTLSEDCQWSVDKVTRIKNALIRKGLIDSKPRYKPNDPGQTSNLYTITTTGVQNYTPPLNLQGGGVQISGGEGCNPAEGPGGNSAGDPPAPISDEVLTIEELKIQELTKQELERDREKIYLSYRLHKIFETIISCLYPQFEDYHFNRWGDDEKLFTDPTTLNLIKKIRGAAAAIHSAYQQLNKPIPKWRDYSHSWSRDEGEPDAAQDGVDQVQSYVEWCRVTKTYITKDPDKLPEKILQDDWCLKLKEWADERFPREYDPMADFDGCPQWILEYFYEEQMVWVDKRNSNRMF